MNGRISCTESKTALQLLDDSSDECVVVGVLATLGGFMSHQAPHQITQRAKLSPATIEELLADPSRTRGLVLESVPELLSQVALRVAALKTLMLSERIATKGLSHAASKLFGARELSELFGVPESWVREQARLGILPSFKLGHYVRFRIEEVERFLTERASQAA